MLKKINMVLSVAVGALLLLSCSDPASLANPEKPKDKDEYEKLEPAVFAAFPTAEGHGRNTTGGRGGEVYYVTTLEDTHEKGSLRYAINQTGARTIMFNVSGTIKLTGGLEIKNGDLTIAGQTAPGDGICIAIHPITIKASNVIIRYLRFRMGYSAAISADGADALEARGQENIIIDHCSMSWSTDECVSIYNNANTTLQWCIISESLRGSGHTKGSHGYGGIWGGRKATFHHNLLAHHDSRNPRIGPGDKSTKTNELVDMRNNVIYNWANNSAYGAEAMHVNIVNNYYKPGPATNTSGVKRGRIMSIDKKISEDDKKNFPEIYNTWGTFYIDGNIVSDGSANQHCKNATEDNWTYGVYNQFSTDYTDITQADMDAMKLSKPLDTDVVTTHTADKALEKVLEFAGCSFKRDALDQRIVTETREGKTTFQGSATGTRPGIIDDQFDIGANPWPELKQGEVAVDSDGDGIPDEWEKKYGTNPDNVADGKNTNLDPDGKYTNLERYLNSLVEEFEKDQNSDAI